MSKINIVWDASILDTFQDCSCKCDYRHNRNRVPLVKAEPLDKGDLVHVGAESYYKSLMTGLKWEQSVENMLLSISTRAATESQLGTDDVDHIKRVMELYADHWRVEDQNWRIIKVESPFSYVLYEDETFRIVMTGKIDLLVTNNRYENLPVDTKSFSRDFEVLRMTNQFINYANAVDSNFLLVNRVGLHDLDAKKPKPPHERFKRVPLSYDSVYKQQWKDNVIVWAMKYWDAVKTNTWEMNLTSCTKYNRICEYYPVCDTSGNEGKLFKLGKDFKVESPWDVTKPLSERK